MIYFDIFDECRIKLTVENQYIIKVKTVVKKGRVENEVL